MTSVQPTGLERTFVEDEIIVSKTDLKGRITYANEVFLRIAGLREFEVIGAPHSLIRHPDMPRCVFNLLWKTIESGKEIFAYVINMAVNGDHYWVFAHVTPSMDAEGRVIGYHSNRRVADRAALDKVIPLYKELVDIENKASNRKEGLLHSEAHLLTLLEKLNVSYDEFIFSL